MATFHEKVYIVDEKEYNKLTHPDVTYAIISKTMAGIGVKNLLKHHKFTCWHDENEYEFHNITCSVCPVIEALGKCGELLCQRQKLWSK